MIDIRQNTHGDFTEGARFTQAVMKAAAASSTWEHLTDVQKECIHHIAQKLQRIVTGNPNFRDHWDDIKGYCDLALDRLPKGE